MDCPCCASPKRRSLLGSAAAIAAGMMPGVPAFAVPSPPVSADAGKMRSIDIHAHYYSETFLGLLGGEGREFGGSYSRTEDSFTFKTPAGGLGPLPTKFIDVDQRLRDMDNSGVDIQAISLSVPMVYWADRRLNAKLARAWNNDASEVHRRHPTRFVVLATLPMLNASDAIDELEYAASLPGVRGVYMGTNINNRDLDDPMFSPVFKRIEQLGLPIFLHPQQTVGGGRLADFYLSNLLGNPFDTAIAASHLILGGVMDQYPALHFSLPHAGGALPILIGRIDAGWSARPETKRLAQQPSTYLRRFSYDTVSHSGTTLDYLIRNIGVEHLVLGSDYCFDMGYEQPVRFLDGLPLSDKEKRLILGGNAARLLRI